MDYLTLAALTGRFRDRLCGQKVRRIRALPGRTVLLSLSGGSELILSADPLAPGFFPVPDAAGVSSPEGGEPADRDETRIFAVLAENRLRRAVLSDVRMPRPGERTVHMTFTHGWPAKKALASSLVLEVMGRHSNLVLIDHTGRITGALKTVSADKSRVRQVVPGRVYAPPPPLAGAPVDRLTPADFKSGTVHGPDDLMAAVAGLSPWTARQWLLMTPSSHPDDLVAAAGTLLASGSEGYLTTAGHRTFLSPFPPRKLHEADVVTRYESLAEAAWAWREGRTATGRKAPAAGRGAPDLHQRLAARRSEIGALLDRLDEEARRCRGFGAARHRGEAILAGIAAVKRGQAEVDLPDPYDANSTLSIALDPRVTPQENARLYFDRARRLERGLGEVERRRAQAEERRRAIEAALEALDDGDVGPALKILEKGGDRGGRAQDRDWDADRKPRAYKGPGKRYVRDGFTILVGRNAADNERLTFRVAGNDDLWLHTRDYAGSHVVILTHGRKVPDEVVRYAALLAADSSQAGGDRGVDVMVTRRKWVRRLKGGRPGQVTVERFRTVRPARTG